MTIYHRELRKTASRNPQLMIQNGILTLVNKWNPIPDNYEINLVEVPGGEKS